MLYIVLEVLQDCGVVRKRRNAKAVRVIREGHELYRNVGPV